MKIFFSIVLLVVGVNFTALSALPNTSHYSILSLIGGGCLGVFAGIAIKK